MMKTECLEADREAIERAGQLIRKGELVAIPTETVYGLGADALNEEAVRKIFAAKGRPADNPLIVHISNMDQLESLISGPVPPMAKALAEAYWPGPLTMIFKKARHVPAVTTGELDTVAVRFPDHPVALKLIDCAGRPIAAPSANPSGRPSPTRAEHVMRDHEGRIPMILDGGACRVGLESTVLDVTVDPPKILRPGGVTPEMIARVAGGVSVDDSALHPLDEGARPLSPGTKYKHYAPKGDVLIIRGVRDRVIVEMIKRYDAAMQTGRRVAIMAREDLQSHLGGREFCSLGESPDDFANRLFDVLRALDREGVELILAEAIETEGVGLAVMNRLLRAAGFHVVDAGE